MRLTNQSALAIVRPEGRPQITVFDDEVPGFGVRVSAKTRVWIISYRNKLGQSKQETVGRVGLLSATEARKAAADMLSRVRLGSDPHTERKAAKVAASLTFGSQIEAYLDMRSKDVSASYLRDLTRSLNVDLAPLHKVPVADMTHGQVHEQIERIARNHPHAAKQARAGLSRFFRTMVSKGIAHRNPVVDVETPATGGARDRVLKDDELRAVWRATAGGDEFSQIVRLLILSGQRREEVAGMLWSEVDLAAATWSMPGSRTKNGLPHEVPLSAPMLEILRRRDDVRLEGRTHVFGRSGRTGFSGFSKGKALLDERCQLATPWRIHDLRRSVSTGLARIRVPPHVIEAILNHVSGAKAGVAGVYNRHLYDAEKREALDLWAEHTATFDPAVQVAPADAVAPR
ncbi:MAG: tyrosine-type recombinase/integrase [Methylobacterium radiotolerans]